MNVGLRLTINRKECMVGGIIRRKESPVLYTEARFKDIFSYKERGISFHVKAIRYAVEIGVAYAAVWYTDKDEGVYMDLDYVLISPVSDLGAGLQFRVPISTVLMHKLETRLPYEFDRYVNIDNVSVGDIQSGRLFEDKDQLDLFSG